MENMAAFVSATIQDASLVGSLAERLQGHAPFRLWPTILWAVASGSGPYDMPATRGRAPRRVADGAGFH